MSRDSRSQMRGKTQKGQSAYDTIPKERVGAVWAAGEQLPPHPKTDYSAVYWR